MKRRNLEQRFLDWAIDANQDTPPPELTPHLDADGKLRIEWKSIRRWAKLLRSKDEWKPDDAFFSRMVEMGMREKQRADLEDSVDVHLLRQPFNWMAFLRQPLRIPAFVPTAIIMAFLMLPVFWIGYQQHQVIGIMDYSRGNVLAYMPALFGGDPTAVTRGGNIQTAGEAESVIRLEGGTEVLLASLSRLQIQSPRELALERGKAFFDIPKGHGGFSVKVPGGMVHVLGTVFSIEINHGNVHVTVIEGRVKVSSALGAVEVAPGQDGVILPQSAPSIQLSQSMPRIQRWVESLRNKRTKEDLKKYYPSLSLPESVEGIEQ